MKRAILLFLFLLSILSFLSAQEIDSIIDVRDGNIYKVVQIGQRWWMQENLNIGNIIDSTQDASNNRIIEKYCYHNSDSLCKIYGGLYQFKEMMDYNLSDNVNPEITSGICPGGWYLPNDNEWTDLTNYLGGELIAGGKLKETGTLHWKSPNTGATNESGFTALPAGWRNLSKNFNLMEKNAFFWSSTRSGSQNAFYRVLGTSNVRIDRSNTNLSYGLSIRCTRDLNQFGYLILLNKNFRPVTNLDFFANKITDTIVIINSWAGKAVIINSISSYSSVYSVNYSNKVLSAGDSIHLTIYFNPPENEIFYIDTLRIESNDPYNPLISIPLKGYKTKTDSILDIRDNHVYKLVKIGEQWWMQENLNTGTRIDGKQNAFDNKNIEKYCYNDIDSLCDIYGGLYQWNEMMDYSPSDNGNPGNISGICPSGFHLPTDNEWTELTDFLGGVSDAGGMLKEIGTLHWKNPNAEATNMSFFTALAAGDCNNGNFYAINDYAYIWSSSENNSDAYLRVLSYDNSVVNRPCYSEGCGFSVRCLRDNNHFGYLVISDKNLKTISNLDFEIYRTTDTIIIINTSVETTINITSIHTAGSAYNLNKSSAVLAPGDSIHLCVVFNPSLKGVHYFDSLFIESDDPYNPLMFVPMVGYLWASDSIGDIRDKQIYKIIKIGEQWWLQENLNIGSRIVGSQDANDNGIIEKYCYNNSDSLCNIYGGLYQWDEMMNYEPSDNAITGTTQGICPIGWHIPTDNEWHELTDFLGGILIAGGKMKESGTLYWNSPNTGATNKSGFSAFAGGFNNFGSYSSLGDFANFWSSTECDTYDIFDRILCFDNSWVSYSLPNKEKGFSVRCLKDYGQLIHLIISDKNFNPVSSMNFYGDNIREELIILNSGTEKTINISSIHTKNSYFNLNKSSSVLLPGDSIHLTLTFNPPDNKVYLDTLFIKSDYPYDSLITIFLNGASPMEISITGSNNVSCFGFSDGSATVTPSLGIPPYYYHWDNPGNTSDSIATGLKANIYYIVTVSDSHGYTLKDSILLTQPAKLELITHYSDAVCLNSNNGFIELNSSGGTPPYSYSWADGQTSQELLNLPASQYFVKISDNNGCIDSAMVTINLSVPYDEEQICIVTSDIQAGGNFIIWKKTSDKGIAQYRIYRENVLIGKVTYNESGIFKDSIISQEIQPYQYSISVIDTCENESKKSSYHKPLFLRCERSVDGITLEWDKYEIEDGEMNFTSYSIYRSIDQTSLTLIKENIPSDVNLYFDNDPNVLQGKYYYRVAGILSSPCWLGESYGYMWDSICFQSFSNLCNNGFTGRIDQNMTETLLISPNPFHDKTTISFPNQRPNNYQLIITNLAGKVVKTISNLNKDKIELNRDGLPAGIYLIELKGTDIYRRKLIIE